MGSSKRYCAARKSAALYLRIACAGAMLYPGFAQAQQEPPPAVEIYRGALDPSGPVNKPLPNPLTHFEIQETKRIIERQPGHVKEEHPFALKNPPADPVIAEKKSRISKPPVPPRKPATMHASESFVREARQKDANEAKQALQAKEKKQAVPVPPVRPVVPAPPKIQAAKAAKPATKNPGRIVTKRATSSKNTPTDVFADNLVQPTLQDILESIDPKAAQEERRGARSGLSLAYRPRVTELPSNIKDILAGGLLKKLMGEPRSRLEIMAFASAQENGVGEAMRISLERATRIRDFMVGKGLSPDRIEIRAMGPPSNPAAQADRVDLEVLKP